MDKSSPPPFHGLPSGTPASPSLALPALPAPTSNQLTAQGPQSPSALQAQDAALAAQAARAEAERLAAEEAGARLVFKCDVLAPLFDSYRSQQRAASKRSDLPKQAAMVVGGGSLVYMLVSSRRAASPLPIEDALFISAACAGGAYVMGSAVAAHAASEVPPAPRRLPTEVQRTLALNDAAKPFTSVWQQVWSELVVEDDELRSLSGQSGDLAALASVVKAVR